MRVGIAHHLGWAVAVTASPDHDVVDRRTIALVEAGIPRAPIHEAGRGLGDAELSDLVATVRESANRATSDSLDELTDALAEPVLSLSLRRWPIDFPADIATMRRSPWEARADSVMYREVLAECARDRGWQVHVFEARDVEQLAAARLGARANDVLHGPRKTLGPPWTKDHRMALAATIVAG